MILAKCVQIHNLDAFLLILSRDIVTYYLF